MLFLPGTSIRFGSVCAAGKRLESVLAHTLFSLHENYVFPNEKSSGDGEYPRPRNRRETPMTLDISMDYL